MSIIVAHVIALVNVVEEAKSLRKISRHPIKWFVVLLAMVGAAWLFFVGPALSDQCFSRTGAVTPNLETVEPFLTNGDAGKQVLRAVQSGDPGEVRRLISANPTLLSTKTVLPDGTRPYNGNSADLVSLAVTRCDREMVTTLLDLGADPSGAIPGLALTYAILADDTSLATVLLNAGASPDASAPGFNTPMHEALMFENTEGIALLASYGADVNRADVFGGVALGTAVMTGNWEAAQVLMDAGANPWLVGNKGVLPAYRIYANEPQGSDAVRIRDDLLARVRADAPFWPPPNAAEVSRNFLDGTWPTEAMRANGFEASEGAMRSMRAAFQ